MLTSGTTALATSSAAAVTVIDLGANIPYTANGLLLISAVAGFFSVDGGTTWARMPAATLVLQRVYVMGDILVKRDGVTDMTGVFGALW